MQSRIAKKNLKNRLLCFTSLFALIFSVCILTIILGSVVFNGYHALTNTKILLPVEINVAEYQTKDLAKLRELSIRAIQQSLAKTFSKISDVKDNKEIKLMHNIVSDNAHHQLMYFILDQYKDNKKPEAEFLIWLDASTEINRLVKKINNDSEYNKFLDLLEKEGRVKKFFNKSLFLNSNSRVPESSGIMGAFIGSILTITVCLFFALPIGIMSGIYLHEFMPKNTLTNLIEISINNLSAVPSIIFGILGFTIYLNIFGIPRSSSLAGGMTLSLMMLPNLIIATKQAFSGVSASVKDGAFALGASNMQVVLHHSLPIALPGILQGTILGIARVLGESSPLLMIGMVAFIADLPKGFLEPATVLPIQIYMWSSNPNAEFIQLAAIGIIALLVMLLVLNLVVSYIRKKFDFFIF